MQSSIPFPSEYRKLYPIEEREQYVLIHVPTQARCLCKMRTNYDPDVYRFLREHPHPNIPAIREYQENDGHLLVIEDYVEGETLRRRLDTAADTLSDAERLRILDEVCDGLSFLHHAQPPIIHRDLKTSNIMLAKDGTIKLIDYDAARSYKSGQSDDTIHIGTPGIAAPEQYGFAQSDARTDVYALGKLTETLFGGSSRYRDIIRRATEIDPRSRYQTVEDFRAALHGSHIRSTDRKILRSLTVAALVLLLVTAAWLLGRSSRISDKTSENKESEPDITVTAALTPDVSADTPSTPDSTSTSNTPDASTDTPSAPDSTSDSTTDDSADTSSVLTPEEVQQIYVPDNIDFRYWGIHFQVLYYLTGMRETRIGYAFNCPEPQPVSLGFVSKQEYFTDSWHAPTEAEALRMADDWIGPDFTMTYYGTTTLAGYPATEIHATDTTGHEHRIVIFYDELERHSRVISLSYEPENAKYSYEADFLQMIASAYRED